MLTFFLGVIVGVFAEWLARIITLKVWERRRLEHQREEFRSLTAAPADWKPPSEEVIREAAALMGQDLAPGPSPTVLMDEKALLAWFTTRKCCPDCGGTDFIEGPSGGSAVNMLCGTCHSEFNMAPPLLVERIGEPRKGRLEVYGLKEAEC